MTPRPLLILIVFILGALAATALGFGVYTVPNHGGPAYGELQDVLQHALGDTEPSLPGPPRTLPVEPLGADSGAAARDWPPSPATDSAPATWLAGAVAASPAAIRAWLGPAVLATSSTRGDTVRTVLWRLTLERGCPLMSRFEATSVGRAERTTRFIALASNCPAPRPR
jgi:hypothetical protein